MTIDTSIPPGDARQVGRLTPDLLLTGEHHLCPGCGEPLALRCLLDTITELDATHRTIGVVGIGGISTDGSGFGVGRLLDTDTIRARVLAVHEGGPDADLPPLPDNERTLWGEP